MARNRTQARTLRWGSAWWTLCLTVWTLVVVTLPKHTHSQSEGLLDFDCGEEGFKVETVSEATNTTASASEDACVCDTNPQEDVVAFAAETCACNEHFGGVTCGACTDDDACDTLGLSCDTKFSTIANNTLYCAGPEDFEETQNTSIVASFNREAQTIDMQLFKYVDGPPVIFACHFSECSYPSFGTSSPRWHCRATHCTCNGDECSLVIYNYIIRMSSNAYVTCNDESGECTFTQDELPVPFVVSCWTGECGMRLDDPISSSATYIVIGAVLAVAAVVAGAIHLQRRKQLKELISSAIPLESFSTRRGTNLTFKAVSYAIGVKRGQNVQHRRILDGVSGRVRSGELMAILGPTGSGKTTLLHLLSGRIGSRKAKENICADGRPITASFRRVTGFVPQEDVLMPSLTVRETLLYGVQLKTAPSLPLRNKVAKVEGVIRDLGLSEVANSRVGSSSKRGLSGGEKRRLSIGLELVSSPSTLFLDEPTSGLDSYNAFKVVDLLRGLGNRGHTIICTIHQPRSNVWELFDQVILLRNGKHMFSGSTGDLRPFVQNLQIPLPTGNVENTADMAVDLITCATNTEADDVVDNFEKHHLEKLLNEIDDITNTAEKETRVLTDQEQDSHWSHFFTQFLVLSSRTTVNMIRDPFLLMTHIIVSSLCAVLVGLIYHPLPDDLAGIQNRAGALFFILALFSFGGLGSMEIFLTGRELFLRERQSGDYSTTPYFLSKVIFEFAPLHVLPPVAVSLITYWFIGFQSKTENFVAYLTVMILFDMCAGAFVMAIGSISRSASVGGFVASIVLMFFMLFSGFLVNKDSIPEYLQWISWLSFYTHGYEALVVTEFTELIITLDVIGLDPIKLHGGVFLENFGFDADNFSRDVYLLVVMLIIYLALAFGALRWRSRDTAFSD